MLRNEGSGLEKAPRSLIYKQDAAKGFSHSAASCLYPMRLKQQILVVNILQDQHIVVVQSLACNSKVGAYRHMLLVEVV